MSRVRILRLLSRAAAAIFALTGGGGRSDEAAFAHARDPVLQEAPEPGAAPQVSVEISALTDTVIAHQTAWIEVRITNSSGRSIAVPFRADKIVAEWRFEDESGRVLLGWPKSKEIEEARRLTLGPREVLYEVLSPESCFGILTSPGVVRATCRVGDAVSRPVVIVRRPARPSDKPSALRAAGPLHGTKARENIQVRLWALCAKESNYFDCDEALFTVAWDRFLISPEEAVAVVDTLIARSPRSGWCRPALLELTARLPENAARRYLESLLARHPGGAAEAFASELLRRAVRKEFPVPGK